MPDPIRTQIINAVVARLGNDTWQGPIVFGDTLTRDETGVEDSEEAANGDEYGANSLTMNITVSHYARVQDEDNKIIDKATWETRFQSERGRAPYFDGELRSYIKSILGNQRLAEIIQTVMVTPSFLNGLVREMRYSEGAVEYGDEINTYIKCVLIFQVDYVTSDSDPFTSLP